VANQAGARARVLVVDDESDVRELIVLALSQAGFDVDDAADGFSALAKVSHRRPDVVITDLRMPGMHGMDLLHRIRRIHADVPVILATGMETYDLCTAAASYGAVTCLVKPLNLEELIWTIEMALTVGPGAQRVTGAAI
jgi:DNA-binding NtrC family response regulator